MNLAKKKLLASRTLNVGKSRIVFVKTRVDEIKEAITKQDIRDLHKEGAIVIKEIKGRKTVVKRKRKRNDGKVKKRVNKTKTEYVRLTRKLREYVLALKKDGRVSNEEFKDIRKKIKNRYFKSRSHLKDYAGGIKQ